MKSRTTAILLCFFLGIFGIHRFYLGYTLIGIIQLLTGGGFFAWALVDFLRLITGSLGPEGSVWKEEAEKAAQEAAEKAAKEAEKAAKAAEEDEKRKEERDKKMEWEREINDKIANVSAKELLESTSMLNVTKEIKKKEEADGNLSIEQRTYLERVVREKIEEEEQRLRSDKEFQDAVTAEDFEAAKERKIALGKEIVAEELRKKGRKCRDLEKLFCTWCMFPDHCMEFVEGEAGDYIWEYRNKDGSKDKRAKDNYQSAGYRSEWLCKECGAKTTVQHDMNKHPSKDVKAWKVTLNTNGSGERFAEDWVNDGVFFADKNKANNKGDN